MQRSWQNKAKENKKPKQNSIPEENLNIWDALKRAKKDGRFKGEIHEYHKPHYNLLKGEHYYEIEDAAKGSIKCVTCPIKHGGILEAHLLSQYELKNGVLYLDGVAQNKTPSIDNNSEAN